jgi:hypothetical protein
MQVYVSQPCDLAILGQQYVLYVSLSKPGQVSAVYPAWGRGLIRRCKVSVVKEMPTNLSVGRKYNHGVLQLVSHGLGPVVRGENCCLWSCFRCIGGQFRPQSYIARIVRLSFSLRS